MFANNDLCRKNTLLVGVTVGSHLSKATSKAAHACQTQRKVCLSHTWEGVRHIRFNKLHVNMLMESRRSEPDHQSPIRLMWCESKNGPSWVRVAFSKLPPQNLLARIS